MTYVIPQNISVTETYTVENFSANIQFTRYSANCCQPNTVRPASRLSKDLKIDRSDDCTPKSLDEMIAIALSVNEVLSVRAFCIDDKQVFAVLITPIYLKSERDNLLKEIQSLLSENTSDEVKVTFDTEIYRKIKDGISDEQKRDLLEKAQR